MITLIAVILQFQHIFQEIKSNRHVPLLQPHPRPSPLGSSNGSIHIKDIHSLFRVHRFLMIVLSCNQPYGLKNIREICINLPQMGLQEKGTSIILNPKFEHQISHQKKLIFMDRTLR